MGNRRILVTGGAGFLGAALVCRLVALGHQVRVLDNGFRSSSSRLAAYEKDIEWIKADIRDAESVRSAIQGTDTIFHLAAINGTKFFYEKPDLVLDVGIRGILNVLDGCCRFPVANLLIASSSEVYQTPEEIPTGEQEALRIPDVFNPRYSYGGSKIITELLALHHKNPSPQKIVIFRPHNVYGPDMGKEHVISGLILKALSAVSVHPVGKVPFPIQGTGEQSRAFIHIQDMVDAMVLLMDRGEHSQIYHVGNPEETKIGKLARMIMNHFGREIDLVTDPLPTGSTERRCPSIEKIKQLGFSPRISLFEGLSGVIEWYKQKEKQDEFSYSDPLSSL